MNALTPMQNSPIATPTMPPPPRALVEWLKRPEEPAEMARSLIRSGRTSALEEALPALRQEAMTEAGEAGVMQVLTAAFVHFPQPKRSPEEWAVFWQGYVTTCGHLSQAAITAGMAKWLADPESKFLPKPGELRHLSTQTPTEAHHILMKARAVLEAVRAEESAERIQQDIAQRGTTAARQAEQVREMLAGVDTQLRAASARQRKEMHRQGVAHANRCVRPAGEINATQADVLAKCGLAEPRANGKAA
jgi:hypothetical protein